MKACSISSHRSGLLTRGRKTLAALAFAASFAAGQERAPRRPPEPFLVFVEASNPADRGLKALIEQALPAVRDRVRRRGWFELAESAEEADITLRLVNYRTEHRSDPNWESFYAPILAIHYVDAIAVAGDERRTLSGLDTRPLGQGASLRNAAGQLAEELERYCRENYRTLTRSRRGRQDPGGAPRFRNAPGR